MGLFDIFKKKEEPKYDPNNITVKDLDYGFILEYDLKTWKVDSVFEYDWGGHYFTKEYLLNSGDDKIYLSVDDNDGMHLTVTKEIKIRKLDEDLIDIIVKTEKAPSKLYWEEEKYFFDEENTGYCRDHKNGTNDWDELISFEYYNEDETKIISISQWDDRNFESFAGIVIKEYEISNILPA